jgi:hypothetical protein
MRHSEPQAPNSIRIKDLDPHPHKMNTDPQTLWLILEITVLPALTVCFSCKFRLVTTVGSRMPVRKCTSVRQSSPSNRHQVTFN